MYNLKSCIVVGAGIAGLLSARLLASKGVNVVLLEKSRGLGGRMATRRVGDCRYDHGAQFMTTRDRKFREMVESWLSQNAVRPWYKGPLGNMRYFGTEGMTTVPKLLSREIDVRIQHKVSQIAFDGSEWSVTCELPDEKTASFKSDFLIFTTPVPQALELIQQSNVELDFDEEDELEKIRYSRCITVLAKLNGPAGISNPGAMDLNHDTLRWVGDNYAKGISTVEGTLTINTSNRFSHHYWDASNEEKIKVVLQALKPFIKSDVVEATAHHWSYSEPLYIYREKQPFRKPYFVDEQNRLALAGDGFGGPRIEASALSGVSLFEELIRAV